ncbi:AbrB/MazE/SpoVT family DNA-binding domain-containing protein [Terracidiphilus sp.]|uniref:AbrB/MazE/SpoVT family DNA-binding domain-containing protein n=1 Tax=Terracidiphilus sp. TaxID=1964191 RepID=UPI003C167393
MKLAKWGNSGAFRIPAEALRQLNWQPGSDDNFNVVVGENEIRIVRKMTREEAIAKMRELSVPLPPGYKFNRDELYDD